MPETLQMDVRASACEHIPQPILGQSMVWYRVGQCKPLVLLDGRHSSWLHWAWLVTQRDHIKRMVRIVPAGHGGHRRQTVSPLHWRDLNPDSDPGGWAERMRHSRHSLLAQMLHAASAADGLAMEIQWRSWVKIRFHSKPFSRSAALAPALRVYPGPVLEIWGEHDVTATPHEMEAVSLLGSCPRKWYIVGESGHWLMHEMPAAATMLMKKDSVLTKRHLREAKVMA